MATTDPPTTTVVRPAKRAERPSTGPTPDQLRSEAPLLIGTIVTLVLMALFLGGALLMTVHYMTSITPPPPV